MEHEEKLWSVEHYERLRQGSILKEGGFVVRYGTQSVEVRRWQGDVTPSGDPVAPELTNEEFQTLIQQTNQMARAYLSMQNAPSDFQGNKTSLEEISDYLMAKELSKNVDWATYGSEKHVNLQERTMNQFLEAAFLGGKTSDYSSPQEALNVVFPLKDDSGQLILDDESAIHMRATLIDDATLSMMKASSETLSDFKNQVLKHLNENKELEATIEQDLNESGRVTKVYYYDGTEVPELVTQFRSDWNSFFDPKVLEDQHFYMNPTLEDFQKMNVEKFSQEKNAHMEDFIDMDLNKPVEKTREQLSSDLYSEQEKLEGLLLPNGITLKSLLEGLELEIRVYDDNEQPVLQLYDTNSDEIKGKAENAQKLLGVLAENKDFKSYLNYLERNLPDTDVRDFVWEWQRELNPELAQLTYPGLSVEDLLKIEPALTNREANHLLKEISFEPKMSMNEKIAQVTKQYVPSRNLSIEEAFKIMRSRFDYLDGDGFIEHHNENPDARHTLGSEQVYTKLFEAYVEPIFDEYHLGVDNDSSTTFNYFEPKVSRFGDALTLHMVNYFEVGDDAMLTVIPKEDFDRFSLYEERPKNIDGVMTKTNVFLDVLHTKEQLATEQSNEQEKWFVAKMNDGTTNFDYTLSAPNSAEAIQLASTIANSNRWSFSALESTDKFLNNGKTRTENQEPFVFDVDRLQLYLPLDVPLEKLTLSELKGLNEAQLSQLDGSIEGLMQAVYELKEMGGDLEEVGYYIKDLGVEKNNLEKITDALEVAKEKAESVVLEKGNSPEKKPGNAFEKRLEQAKVERQSNHSQLTPELKPNPHRTL